MTIRTHSGRRGIYSKNSIQTTVNAIVDTLKARGNLSAVAGMARFGIQTSTAFGVSVPELRRVARRVGRSHELAEQLWKTGLHDARLLAGMIDDPAAVSEAQMEEWVRDFDSWDIVDGTCGNLFDKTPFAVKKAREWSARQREYVKRAGFVLMAEMAVHNKVTPDKIFLDFLPVIVRESSDDRNFVKKAVNWALRQIGKRNPALNRAALRTCTIIGKLESRSAKWIAADAVRELTSAPVRSRLTAESLRVTKKRVGHYPKQQKPAVLSRTAAH
jgi:3-methyladenine DNA glycosylase AlkD